MKPLKQPRDHKFCSKCDMLYSFIYPRLTTSDRRNICMKCGAEEFNSETRLSTAKKKDVAEEVV